MMNTRQSARNTVKPENKGLTALYCRLSKDDEMRNGDSVSIKHQREVLEKFAKSNGFTNITCFADDGVSGTTFQRDDWQRLIAEIEKGNVSVLCVKDMSRLGRDHVQVGVFLERCRQAGIRFIAVENNIDSIYPETLEFAPFINIMSEWYECVQVGATIFSAFFHKTKSGRVYLSAPDGFTTPAHHHSWHDGRFSFGDLLHPLFLDTP